MFDAGKLSKSFIIKFSNRKPKIPMNSRLIGVPELVFNTNVAGTFKINLLITIVSIIEIASLLVKRYFVSFIKLSPIHTFICFVFKRRSFGI